MSRRRVTRAEPDPGGLFVVVVATAVLVLALLLVLLLVQAVYGRLPGGLGPYLLGGGVLFGGVLTGLWRVSGEVVRGGSGPAPHRRHPSGTEHEPPPRRLPPNPYAPDAADWIELGYDTVIDPPDPGPPPSD